MSSEYFELRDAPFHSIELRFVIAPGFSLAEQTAAADRAVEAAHVPGSYYFVTGGFIPGSRDGDRKLPTIVVVVSFSTMLETPSAMAPEHLFQTIVEACWDNLALDPAEPPTARDRVTEGSGPQLLRPPGSHEA